MSAQPSLLMSLIVTTVMIVGVPFAIRAGKARRAQRRALPYPYNSDRLRVLLALAMIGGFLVIRQVQAALDHLW